MNTKRNKLNRIYLAALLAGGLMVSVFAGAWSQSGDDGLLAAAPAEKKGDTANARLISDLDIVLKNLAKARKAVSAGNKSQALKSLTLVKDLLAGIRKRAEAPGKNVSAAAAVKGWTEDLDKAMAFAASSKRPILLDFSGSDWCGWCIKLHEEVFSKDEFKKYADKNLVLVEVDFPRSKKQSTEVKKRNNDLAKKYGIQGFPTIIILDPTGKKELGRTGYVRGGPAPFIAGVKKIVGK